MKAMKATSYALLALVAAATVRATGVEIDAIAARVGTEAILRSDVIEEMKRTGAPAERFNATRDAMIERKLVLKAALEAKMTMQSWVVENRIRDIIKKAFGGDRNKLIKALSEQKISYPEWAAKMKEDMIVSAMRWNVVDKNAVASPSEMLEEYKSNSARYSSERKVTVSVILLKPEDAAKRDKIKAELKDSSFADLARRYSADSRAAEGGLWKDVKPEEVFNPAVCREISAMPRGTVGDWIEIDGWNFLLRKEDESGGKVKTFAEAYDEIERNVIEAKSKKIHDAWIARLREETYVKVY